MIYYTFTGDELLSALSTRGNLCKTGRGETTTRHSLPVEVYRTPPGNSEELDHQRLQIDRGLKMGREEIIKMTRKYLMEPPLLLLLLTHDQHGTPFFHAVLSVLHEHQEKTQAS